MPPSSDRRRQKSARVRQRLMDQGLRLMGGGDLHRCKVEEITSAAGVGKGTFFTHFASKESFVAELVKMVLDDLARRVRPVGLSPTDAEALLSGVGAVHLRYFQLRPQAAGLLIQACALDPDSAAGQDINQCLARHLEMVAEMTAPAGEQLGWPRERARDLALMVLATACGFFWFGRSRGGEGDTPSQLLDRLGRALARGLAAGEPG